MILSHLVTPKALRTYDPVETPVIMNRKSTIIAAVLLIGAVAVAIILKQNSGNDQAPQDPALSNNHQASGNNSAFAPDQSAKASNRKERETADAELVAQYGESRTNLSRHVAENVALLLDDAIEMGEMMSKGGGFGRGDWALRRVTGNSGIELNDDQQAQLKEIYGDYQKRELDKSRAAVEALKKNPSTLMGLLLASDARSRDELSEDDYSALQKASADELKDVINPLDRKNFRGGEPLDDPDFLSGFESILDPDQAETFDAKRAEEAASAEETEEPGRDITNIPVMDLESLDQAVGSAQQMTSGFKQVMQGMGNLRELEPKINPKTDSENEAQ